MKKPRKRRTQTLAEKGTEEAPAQYRWEEFLGNYTFKPSGTCNATIAPLGEGWTMAAVIDGKRYLGKRPTLEEAFKATDQLIFQHARKYWLRMDARVVLAPWKGDLTCHS